MSSKTQMSTKTKRILTGLGIGFGTVMVFLVSFILAFSLIVNPINFFTVSDAGTVEENEKLKDKVQSLSDEIEVLNTTVDKYKAQANAPKADVPAIVTTPVSDTTSATAQQPENTQTPEATEDTSDNQESESFSPDVVDSTAEQTPEDVEAPITVIDISE